MERKSVSEEQPQIPAQLQEQLAQLQQLQQTLQVIASQRQQVEMELADTDRALEELKGIATDGTVYKSVGSILVKKDQASVEKDLNERKELLNVRASVLGKQENKTREKLKSVQQQVQSRFKTATEKPAPS
jgi:prefoldin beta subunit